MGRMGRGYAFLALLLSFCCVAISFRNKGRAAVAHESTAPADIGEDILGFDLKRLFLESADELIFMFLSIIAFVFAYASLKMSVFVVESSNLGEIYFVER